MAGPAPDPPPPPNREPSDGRHGYDRLRVREGDGTVRYLMKSQFEALPLGERVRLLMGGNLQFFRGAEQLTAREALRGV